MTTTTEPLKLRPREREIIALIADGVADSDIAPQLGISLHTIRTHVKNALRRNGLHGRVVLAVRFDREGR